MTQKRESEEKFQQQKNELSEKIQKLLAELSAKETENENNKMKKEK